MKKDVKSFRLSKTTLDLLEAIAKKERRKQTEMLEIIIEDAAKARKIKVK